MTKEELKKFNGKDGQPTYIGYKGKVYDISKSDFWDKGTHMGIVFAGEDLTDKIGMSPHGEQNIFRFPEIDVLTDGDGVEAPAAEATTTTDSTVSETKEPAVAQQTENILSDIDQKKIARMKWYRKNHPHPVTVHFPIAFFFLAFLLQILGIIFSSKVSFFSSSSLLVSLLGVLFLVPTVASGLMSFYINYNGFANKIMKKKIAGTAVLAITSIVTLIIGAAEFTNGFDKNLIDTIGNITEYSALKSVYTLFTLINTAIVLFIGMQGGKLTWPEQK